MEAGPGPLTPTCPDRIAAAGASFTAILARSSAARHRPTCCAVFGSTPRPGRRRRTSSPEGDHPLRIASTERRPVRPPDLPVAPRLLSSRCATPPLGPPSRYNRRGCAPTRRRLGGRAARRDPGSAPGPDERARGPRGSRPTARGDGAGCDPGLREAIVPGAFGLGPHGCRRSPSGSASACRRAKKARPWRSDRPRSAKPHGGRSRAAASCPQMRERSPERRGDRRRDRPAVSEGPEASAVRGPHLEHCGDLPGLPFRPALRSNLHELGGFRSPRRPSTSGKLGIPAARLASGFHAGLPTGAHSGHPAPRPP